MKTLNCICLTLTIIGAIVWGIIGLFSYNIVDGIFGAGTAFSRIIYTLVGVAGLYAISFYWLLKKEIEYLENSDMPGKDKIIKSLRTASSN